jgi:hypothetical protein
MSLAFVVITATPLFIISAMYYFGLPLNVIVPAGIIWLTLCFGYKALRGDE